MPRGAPTGNRNGAKARDWADAIKHQLADYEDTLRGVAKGQALRALAKTVIAAAMAGEKWAVEEVANRLDGKPAQQIDVGGVPDAPLTVLIASADSTVL